MTKYYYKEENKLIFQNEKAATDKRCCCIRCCCCETCGFTPCCLSVAIPPLTPVKQVNEVCKTALGCNAEAYGGNPNYGYDFAGLWVIPCGASAKNRDPCPLDNISPTQCGFGPLRMMKDDGLGFFRDIGCMFDPQFLQVSFQHLGDVTEGGPNEGEGWYCLVRMGAGDLIVQFRSHPLHFVDNEHCAWTTLQTFYDPAYQEGFGVPCVSFDLKEAEYTVIVNAISDPLECP